MRALVPCPGKYAMEDMPNFIAKARDVLRREGLLSLRGARELATVVRQLPMTTTTTRVPSW